MRRLFFIVLLIVGLVAGCAIVNQPTEDETEDPLENNIDETKKQNAEENEEENATPEEEPLPDELTVLAENLNAPWSIEKIENTFYITERSGAIVKVEDEEETRQEVELSNDLATAEEAGF